MTLASRKRSKSMRSLHLPRRLHPAACGKDQPTTPQKAAWTRHDRVLSFISRWDGYSMMLCHRPRQIPSYQRALIRLLTFLYGRYTSSACNRGAWGRVALCHVTQHISRASLIALVMEFGIVVYVGHSLLCQTSYPESARQFRLLVHDTLCFITCSLLLPNIPLYVNKTICTCYSGGYWAMSSLMLPSNHLNLLHT